MQKKLLLILFALVLGMGQIGCYAVTQTKGQVHISKSAISLEEARELPWLNEEQLRNLDLVGEVKKFAEEEIGLTKTDNYTTYYPNRSGRPIMWVLIGAHKDRLEPYMWRYPIVGKAVYRSFFSKKYAKQARCKLKKKNLDTYLRSAGAYSTSGWFKDPILPELLNRPQGWLIETIIHELGHSTVISKDDTAFNESFAVFIQHVGAEMFLTARDGPNSKILQDLKDSNADSKHFNRFIQQVAEMAKEIYADKSITLKERRGKLNRDMRKLYDSQRPFFRTARYRQWQLPRLNNAWIISNLTYGTTEPFRKAFEAVGKDTRRFIALCQEATKDENPFEKLKELTKQTLLNPNP